MYRVIVITFLTAIIGLLLLLVATVFDPIPNTASLDGDLKFVREQIGDARREADQYSGGAIQAFIRLRLATLQHTEALLEQKKSALLRRVWLHYTVDGRTLIAANDADLKSIISDIEQAEQKLGRSTAEAAQYSGGLIHAMARMTVETDRMSIAQLRLKLYSAKYGFPIFAETFGQNQNIPAPGRIVEDKNAF